MKRLIMLFTLVVAVFTACSSGQKENKESSQKAEADTPKDVIQTIEATVPGNTNLKFETAIVENTIMCPEGNGEDDKMHYSISFTYPSEFSNQKVLEKLKQHFIDKTFGEDSSGQPLDKAIDVVVAGWKGEYLEDCAEQYCDRGIYDSIMYVSDELLQYCACAYETNGSNNSGMLSYHLLSLQTGDEYQQADIFTSESANDIRQLIISQIKSQEYVDPDWDLEQAWTTETNFSIADKGIFIHLNYYDLGTRRGPEEDILLPYKQILPYLKKDTPVYTLANAK